MFPEPAFTSLIFEPVDNRVKHYIDNNTFVKNILSDEKFNNALLKYTYYFYKKDKTLNKIVELYVDKVLNDYFFSHATDKILYADTKILVDQYITLFHKSKYVNIPIVGKYFAYLISKINKNKVTQIKNNIVELYTNSNGSVYYNSFNISNMNCNIDVHAFIRQFSFVSFIFNKLLFNFTMDQIVNSCDIGLSLNKNLGIEYDISDKKSIRQFCGIVSNISSAITINRKISWWEKTKYKQIYKFSVDSSLSNNQILSEDFIKYGYINCKIRVYRLISKIDVYTQNTVIMSYDNKMYHILSKVSHKLNIPMLIYLQRSINNINLIDENSKVVVVTYNNSSCELDYCLEFISTCGATLENIVSIE